MARLRRVAPLLLLALLSGCMSVQSADGQPHPDLDVELLVQVLADIDYIVTNYAWVLALLGL